MSMTETIIEGLAGEGFAPPEVLEFTDAEVAAVVCKTVAYFEPDAFRVNGDDLTLAWFGEDELRLIVMTHNGVGKARATFDRSELGVELFLKAAAL